MLTPRLFGPPDIAEQQSGYHGDGEGPQLRRRRRDESSAPNRDKGERRQRADGETGWKSSPIKEDLKSSLEGLEEHLRGILASTLTPA